MKNLPSKLLAALILTFTINCGSTADPPAAPRPPVVDNPETRAYDCCRAFWDAHDVLTAHLTPEDIDCHEPGPIERYTRDLSGIDASKRQTVLDTCRA